MTIPLPGGMADKLLRHIGNCPICKAARIYNKPNYCAEGQQLIRLTIEERHGSDERRTQGGAEQGA